MLSRRSMITGMSLAAMGMAVNGNSQTLQPRIAHDLNEADRDTVLAMWPEIKWIESEAIQNQVVNCWISAFKHSSLKPSDLYSIPFSVRIPNCEVSFMAHKQCVVRIAFRAAKEMGKSFAGDLAIDIDTLTAGAILADVGKLLEYEIVGSAATVSSQGKLIRHPFSGAHLALQSGLSDEVIHIIATHSSEGDLVTRSTESQIVHYADYMCTYPFVALAQASISEGVGAKNTK